ncbi:hypothetical protein MBLNU459_g3183t2 [Dothideomycetes sp. NU459]
MPSSSQRNTRMESNIFATYTAAYARLRLAEEHLLLEEVTELFSDLLDMSAGQLTKYALGWNNRDALMAESQEGMRHTKAGMVWTAGSCVHDVAWMLMKRYGIEAAAAKCFRIAAELQQEAQAIHQEAQAIHQARDK